MWSALRFFVRVVSTCFNLWLVLLHIVSIGIYNDAISLCVCVDEFHAPTMPLSRVLLILAFSTI